MNNEPNNPEAKPDRPQSVTQPDPIGRARRNWHAHNREGVNGWVVAPLHPSGDGSHYAPITQVISKDDALLIAASDDLLAALKGMIKVAIWDNEYVTQEDCNQAVLIAEAAIAKAGACSAMPAAVEASYGPDIRVEDIHTCPVCKLPLGQDEPADTVMMPDAQRSEPAHCACADQVRSIVQTHRDNPSRFIAAVGRLRKGGQS